MKRKVNWNEISYKDWIGLPAALVFWVASLICFIFGLAFKTGSGMYIPGIPFNLEMLFSLGLGFANTAIQIVGNDTDREDLGVALWLMWIASYLLGIGSNVNFLNQKIGLDSVLLQFMVCWGLGIMIEVAPERLLVKFLRASGVLGKSQPLTPIPAPQKPQSSIPKEVRHEEMRRRAMNRQMTPQPGRDNIRKDGKPDAMQDMEDLPEFLKRALG